MIMGVCRTSFRGMKHTLTGRQEKMMMKLIVDPKTDKARARSERPTQTQTLHQATTSRACARLELRRVLRSFRGLECRFVLLRA